MMRNTRGFTLAELLVATVVMGILGLALTQILIGDSRFVSRVEAMMNARQIARAAMNTMAVELRMISNDGLTYASRTEVEARVPYSFGVLCQAHDGHRHAVLVPTDSLIFATATLSGMAWKTSSHYAFHEATDLKKTKVKGVQDPFCTDEGVRMVPDGELIELTISDDTLVVGDVFYVYQTVRYWFSTSVEIPGRLALWRQQGGGVHEELLTPFDPSSAFRFYVANRDTSQITPPADLSDVTGLDLVLVGASEITPQGSSAPPSFEIRTRVNFLNRR